MMMDKSCFTDELWSEKNAVLPAGGCELSQWSLSQIDIF